MEIIAGKFEWQLALEDVHLNIEARLTKLIGDAWSKMAHKDIDRVPIDELEGRVTAMLVTPYPPGIPLLIPGERFNKSIVDYLRFARDFNQHF